MIPVDAVTAKVTKKATRTTPAEITMTGKDLVQNLIHYLLILVFGLQLILRKLSRHLVHRLLK